MQQRLGDLGRALDEMRSDDIETRVMAVEKVTDWLAELAKAAVGNLELPGRARLFVAERLSRLGSVAIGPLQGLLQQSTDPEARLHAAIVLLQLGSMAGVPVLVEAVREGKTEVCLAALWLARTGVPEAGSAIEARLDACGSEDTDLVVCLTSALQKVGRPLPEHLRQRFLGPQAPRSLRMLLREQ